MTKGDIRGLVFGLAIGIAGLAIAGPSFPPQGGGGNGPLTTGDLQEVTDIGPTTTTAISATGANTFGASGVTTTFTGAVQDVTIVNGITRGNNFQTFSGAETRFIADNSGRLDVPTTGLYGFTDGTAADDTRDAMLQRGGVGVVDVNASFNGGGDGDLATAHVLTSTGSNAAPAHSFIGDPNTGFYETVGDQVKLSSGGIQTWAWALTGHSTAIAITATAANNFGGNGKTTTFTGTTNATITDGVIAGDTINMSGGIVYTAFTQHNDGITAFFGTSSDAQLHWNSAQQVTAHQLMLGTRASGDVNGGGALIITDRDNQTTDHDHPVSSTPSLIIHSQTSPDTANDEWVRFRHDVTDAVISTGSGDLRQEPFGGVTQVEQAGRGKIGTFTATEILDVSGSETTTGLIPAGTWNVRACARNTSTIVATTGVSYTIGISGGDTDAFGTGIVYTDTNSTDSTDWTAAQPGWSASAREIVVAPDAGTLDTGTIQIVVFYDILTAQTED